MTFFIVYGKELIKLEQHVNESRRFFLQRVEFLIYALDQGHSIEYSQTLSYVYQNKMRSPTTYPRLVEETVQKVIDYMADVGSE